MLRRETVFVHNSIYLRCEIFINLNDINRRRRRACMQRKFYFQHATCEILASRQFNYSCKNRTRKGPRWKFHESVSDSHEYVCTYIHIACRNNNDHGEASISSCKTGGPNAPESRHRICKAEEFEHLDYAGRVRKGHGKGRRKKEGAARWKGFSRRLASQSPSHDWCFHFSGVHHHRDKKCKPSTPTCKTLVESAFREIGSRWAVVSD